MGGQTRENHTRRNWTSWTLSLLILTLRFFPCTSLQRGNYGREQKLPPPKDIRLNAVREVEGRHQRSTTTTIA